MNLSWSARAVNETEIIKRRYLPLRFVNPRSNKAAVETARRGRKEGRERQRRVPSVTSILHGGTVARKRKRREVFSRRFFNYSLAISRLSRARRKRHFARNGRQTIGRERRKTGVRCGEMLSERSGIYVVSGGLAGGSHVSGKLDWRKRG